VTARKQAPSAATREGAIPWTRLAADDDDERRHQFIARELRAWSGRVLREVGEFSEIVRATYDEETRTFRDEDDEPIEDVVAVDLTRPAPRPRSGYATEEQRGTERVQIRFPRAIHADYSARAEREGLSLPDWIRAACADRAAR
jgi:hypothetical protein